MMKRSDKGCMYPYGKTGDDSPTADGQHLALGRLADAFNEDARAKEAVGERRLEDDLTPDAKLDGEVDDLGDLARRLAEGGGERRKAVAEKVEDCFERICGESEGCQPPVAHFCAPRMLRTGDSPLFEIVERRAGEAELAAYMRESCLTADLAQDVTNISPTRGGYAFEQEVED